MKEKYKTADCMFHFMQWYSTEDVRLGLFEMVFNVREGSEQKKRRNNICQ